MPYSEELLNQMSQAQDVFVWEAPSWVTHDRGKNWYTLMTVAAIVLALFGLFTNNYLFALIVILTAIILLFVGNEKARTYLIQIGHNGIVVGEKFYLFDDIDSFSIIYQPPETKILYVEHKSFMVPRMKIFLQDQDPVEMRTHLRQYVGEDLDLQEEHISDKLARLLKL